MKFVFEVNLLEHSMWGHPDSTLDITGLVLALIQSLDISIFLVRRLHSVQWIRGLPALDLPGSLL